MKTQFIFLAVAFFMVISCSQPNENQLDKDEHDHEKPSVQYTVYSSDFELFAEADPFIKTNSAQILAHFSRISDFKPLTEGRIKLSLTINQKTYTDIQEKPVRPGIYLFHLTPEVEGTGTLQFDIENQDGHFTVLVPEVKVYDSEELAHRELESQQQGKTNSSVFTKEQSWKIDFKTSFPEVGDFGQIIKTTALVESLPANEFIVSAQASGFVVVSAVQLLNGVDVIKGQALMTISGSNLSDNNILVKFQEATSNYERAKAEYDRANALFKDKIVSESDFLSARSAYEIAKSYYDNLNKTVGKTGQTVHSPAAGFIKQIFVKNGSFVEAGQKLMVISNSKELLLKAEIPQRYYPVLGSLQSAVIKIPSEDLTYSLEQLQGKILAYGKAANSDSYQIPVILQLKNPGAFLPGSFVEVFLKASGSEPALFIPASALIEEQGNFFVWVQINPELFEKREVFPGATDGMFYEIKSGVLKEERIVTKGAMMIKLAQATGALDAHSGHVH